MATAPDWTDEEKRKRRDLRRRAAQLPGGTAALAMGDAYRTAGVPGVLNVELGRGPFAGDQLEDGTAAPVAAPTNAFRGVRAAATSSANDLDPRRVKAAGLTRVVKTADGVYTDDPNARGETRYYDATGSRADIGAVNITPGMTPGGYYDAERAAATDLTQEGNRAALLDRGRQGLRRVDAMKAESAQRQNSEFLEELGPVGRAKLVERQLTEAGLDRRAAAQLAVTQQGQDIQRGQLQVTAANAQRTQDNYERERLSDPETSQAAIREMMGGLSNLSATERVRVLSNPADARSARIRDAVRQAAVSQGADPNFTPAQAKRTGGLRRFASDLFGSQSRYTDDTGFMLGNGFNPQEFGLSDEEWEAIMAADAQVLARNRR